MKQLPADIVLQIQSNTLWSKEEESLLAKTSAVGTEINLNRRKSCTIVLRHLTAAYVMHHFFVSAPTLEFIDSI